MATSIDPEPHAQLCTIPQMFSLSLQHTDVEYVTRLDGFHCDGDGREGTKGCGGGSFFLLGTMRRRRRILGLIIEEEHNQPLGAVLSSLHH